MLFKKLGIQKWNSLLYTILIFAFFEIIIYYGANYNVLALIFTLIGIILKIEKYKNNKNIKLYNLYEGVIIFLTVFTKQNIGLYYLISGIFVEILINKTKGIKNLVKQYIIVGVFSILWIVYLFANDALYNFIDYAILGMKEFSIENIFALQNYLLIHIIMIFFIFANLKHKR